MPTYLFIHPETEETKEVLQKLNEPHFYVDEEGVKWQRLFTPPNVATDTQSDPFSKQAFTDKTSKGGSLGDLYDHARECSERRKDKLGHDPVQKKWFKNYSKDRKGKKHPHDPDQ